MLIVVSCSEPDKESAQHLCNQSWTNSNHIHYAQLLYGFPAAFVEMFPMSKYQTIALLLAAAVALVGAQERDRDTKNVLLMVIDDGGFQMTPYGNAKCKTPNIANLSKQSVKFKNAFTSVSSCSPSRSAILTGMPQHQNGMYGLHHGIHHFSSFDNIQSLPRMLNESGKYWTGIIGKKHVGPEYVYPFQYAFTEENNDLMQVGRNITLIKNLARNFLSEAQSNNKPFFLYIGFFDVHRCGQNLIQEYGQFCEKFGDGSPGMGVIPDWQPITYSPDKVEVPFFIQDSLEARKDITALYKGMSRIDQGVGLMLQALKDYGFDNNTLVILTADNGIPFPGAKTNLYDPGMGEPLFVSSPFHKSRWGVQTAAMASATDIVPTILDWFDVKTPSILTGHSLLPVVEAEPTVGYSTIFSSHDFHEITNYYPMRVMRTKQYKLVHNLNYKMPYPIAGDVFISPTFQDLLNSTTSGKDTKWYKTMHQYYYRSQWELYNIVSDSQELTNLANHTEHQDVLKNMQAVLYDWQNITQDPWLCAPSGMLTANGCQALYNDT